jgi:hypothetical protein
MHFSGQAFDGKEISPVSVQLTFLFDSDRRARFANGALVQEWYEAYGDMFDENDYRLARSQPGNHFFEWLAAVLLREATGYYSLIEKYESANHAAKVDAFRRTVDSVVFDFAMAHRTGLPDLFVYQPGTPNWFFCEVKGGPDRLSQGQIDGHRELERISKRPVSVLWLHPL